MDIDKLTIGELKQLVAMAQGLGVGCTSQKQGDTHAKVGENILIRGVTLYYVGHVESVSETEIVLSDASWVADTGRFNEALRTGVLNEVEPFPNGAVTVKQGAIMDYSPWPHPLPKEVK
jgi:hypothetical protein